MEYFVYVLQSESRGSYYVGSTENIQTRLKKHNAGDNLYTKGRRPWKVVYQESFCSRTEAIKREHFFKSGVGRKQLKEILASQS